MFCSFLLLKSFPTQIHKANDEYKQIKDSLSLVAEFLADGTSQERIFNASSVHSSEELMNFREKVEKNKINAEKYSTINGKVNGIFVDLLNFEERDLNGITNTFNDIFSLDSKPFTTAMIPPEVTLLIGPVWKYAKKCFKIFEYDSEAIDNVYILISDDRKAKDLRIGDIVNAFDLKIDFLFDMINVYGKGAHDKEYTVGNAIEGLYMNKETWENFLRQLRGVFVDDKISYKLAMDSFDASLDVIDNAVLAGLKVMSLLLNAATDPLFKLFDPAKEPVKRIDALLGVCDEIGKAPFIKRFAEPLRRRLIKFKTEGLDFRTDIPFVDSKMVDLIFDQMLALFDLESTLMQTIEKLAANADNTGMLNQIYAIGNITNNIADENATIKEIIEYLQVLMQDTQVMSMYQKFIDAMKELSNENLPIYDCSFLSTYREPIKDLINNATNIAKLMLSETIHFNEAFPEYADMLREMKEIFTGINVNKLVSKYTERDFKVSKLLPFLELIGGEKSFLPSETKAMVNKVAASIRAKGDSLTTKDVFKALEITDVTDKIVKVIDMALNNEIMNNITKELPNYNFNTYETIKKFSVLEVPSLFNIANCFVPIKQNEIGGIFISKIYKLSKTVAENPDTFTTKDVCQCVDFDAEKVVAPMKEVNRSIKAMKTKDVAEKAIGHDITRMANAFTNLAKNGKEGKITVSDVSEAADAAHEALSPVVPDNKVMIIAIAVGCSVGVIILIVIGVVCYKRKKREEESEFTKI